MVEKLGVARAREEAERADAVIYVFDASRASTPRTRASSPRCRRSRILVANKSDRPPAGPLPEGAARLCGLERDAGRGLRESSRRHDRLGRPHRGDLGGAGVAAPAGPRRARTLATEETLAALSQGHSPEYAVTHCHAALDALADLTGETTSDDVLDRLFHFLHRKVTSRSAALRVCALRAHRRAARGRRLTARLTLRFALRSRGASLLPPFGRETSRAASGCGRAAARPLWRLRPGPVEAERLGEEDRHLPARQRRVGAVDVGPAPSRDPGRREGLDELEEGMRVAARRRTTRKGEPARPGGERAAARSAGGSGPRWPSSGKAAQRKWLTTSSSPSSSTSNWYRYSGCSGRRRRPSGPVNRR